MTTKYFYMFPDNMTNKLLCHEVADVESHHSKLLILPIQNYVLCLNYAENYIPCFIVK